MRERTECTGVVMAGGRATRFGGEPKGLELVGGVRVIDRVATALQSCCDRVIMIANDPDAQGWLKGVDVYSDVITGAGALGGIHAALHHANSNVIIVAWDMPFVPPSLLLDLRAAGGQADAVLPASGNRRGLEPLCAYYSPECLGPIERALHSGDRRAIAFHDKVRLRVLSYAELSRHGIPEIMFMNINTPEDLLAANRIAVELANAGDAPEET